MLCRLVTLVLVASATTGCSFLSGEKKDPNTFDCSRVPAADVEAVVGKLTKPPKDTKDKANGGRCRYAFKDNYVDLLAPPATMFDGVAAEKHLPLLPGIREQAFRHADVSLTVDGLGDSAYLANATGSEYVLWVKSGTCVIAIQSTIDPALKFDDYRKIATAALARKPCR